MQSQLGSSLFAPLSTQTASQTKGGWAPCHSYKCAPKVKVIYKTVHCYDPCKSHDPCKGTTPYRGNINVTNPRIDDGSIVNFTSGSAVNITNPDIDDGSIVNF